MNSYSSNQPELRRRAVDNSTSNCTNNDTMKPPQIAGIVVASVGGLIIAALLGFYLGGNRQARLARKAAAASSSSRYPDRPRKGGRNQAPSSLYSLEAVPPLRPPRAPFTESGWLEASSKETLALPSTPQAPPSTPVSSPQGCMKKKSSSSSSSNKKPLRKSQYATRQLPPLPYELNTENAKPSCEWPQAMRDSPGAATFVSYP